MNAWALARVSLWMLSGALAVAAIERGRPGAAIGVGAPNAPFADIPKHRTPIPADSSAALANRIAGADAFRLARRPSPVAFGAAPENAAPVTPKPPKPPLVVSGIIGGPPWVGVLDGVPGHDRSVIVRVGDTLAGLRISKLNRDQVVVVGLDTTWRLAVHHPWP